MIYAGTCLYIDNTDTEEIRKTAIKLKEIGVDKFRCKIFGGGSTPEKYYDGMGYDGISELLAINEFIPVGTEIHTPDQLLRCRGLNYLWIGARNSANYSLLKETNRHKGDILIKRGMTMSVEETKGIYDIMVKIHKKEPYIIERGVAGIHRNENKWHIDLNSLIDIKNNHPEMFKRIIVDCSHSCFNKNYIKDIYQATRSIGIKHFMFECTYSGKSRTDQEHMLSVDELRIILDKKL